ncbi:MAG: hypothetical protein AAFR61_08260 [Bacteroidota bacterium]
MFQNFVEGFQSFLANLGIIEEAGDVSTEITLFILFAILSGLATLIFRGVKWWNKRRQEGQFKADLHPYFSATDIRKATQFYVPTQFQSNAPSQHSELIQANRVTARQRLIPFFLQQAFKPGATDQRFYIVLAGSGMGKTTFMLNLYMRYVASYRLRKAPFHIKLLPLGYPDLLRRIEEIPDQPNTILLLDGLDEDHQAVKNYKKRLKDVLDRVRDFRVVVFTCRTQFFPSEEEEPAETGVLRFGSHQGYQHFAKLYLSPFNEKDIHRYLRKRYGWLEGKRKKQAMRIVAQTPNLMVRPMILSYIEDLMEEPQVFDYSSQLYKKLIDKWIDREADRVPAEKRENFRKQLYLFSMKVALNIYEERKRRNGLFIGEKDIRAVAQSHSITLGEIELKSRSLLNRNAQGQYKFAHKSILEYFLALRAVEHPAFAQKLSFVGMDQARLFFNELCLERHTMPLFHSDRAAGTYRMGDGPEIPLQEVKPEELSQITHLHFTKLRQTEALPPLINLRYLYLSGTEVRDINALASLDKLEELYVDGLKIQDWKALKSLERLKILHANQTPFQDLQVLRGMRHLEELCVNETGISDLQVLSSMSDLRRLECCQTQVKDLQPIRRLKGMEVLRVQQTQVQSLGPLKELVALRKLHVGQSGIGNVSALRSLHELEELDVSQTEVHALKPLASLARMKMLNLARTGVADLTPLRKMMDLDQLNLDYSKIHDLSGLEPLPKLQRLSLRGVGIKNFQRLRDLPRLKKVVLAKNQLSAEEMAGLKENLPHGAQVEVGASRN